ncbi:hypothetical protein HK098_002088 [Nowakowskiella sp. JEL0407]|nr:hypothetical protein HK098_002085 [Nowakowskiella sp. JEL0407]KAJ3123250.1 hypothetical protein HK098_002088 [Nowakowskiella sp. JEL0407]
MASRISKCIRRFSTPCNTTCNAPTPTVSDTIHASPVSPSSLRYCQDLVRNTDHENYLCSLFIPRENRDSIWSLRAFNSELADVLEKVHGNEQRVAEGRFRFWEDVIDKLFQGTPTRHPVAEALADTISKHRLSKAFFKRIISERRSQFQQHSFSTTADMETYAENLTSSLLYLQLQSLEISDVNADHAATHIGKAIGISSCLRNLPWVINGKGHLRLDIPNGLLAKYSISADEILRKGPSDKLADMIFEIATVANNHLQLAKELEGSVPKNAIPGLLSATATNEFLKKLERYNFNIFEKNLYKKDWKLPILLYRNFRRGVFV